MGRLMLSWNHGIDLVWIAIVGGLTSGAHDLIEALESLEAWRKIIGHISWSTLALEQG